MRLPKTQAEESEEGPSYAQIFGWYSLEISVRLDCEGKYLYDAWASDSNQNNIFHVDP